MYNILVIIILHFICAYYLRNEYDPGKNKDTLFSSIISSLFSLQQRF